MCESSCTVSVPRTISAVMQAVRSARRRTAFVGEKVTCGAKSARCVTRLSEVYATAAPVRAEGSTQRNAGLTSNGLMESLQPPERLLPCPSPYEFQR